MPSLSHLTPPSLMLLLALVGPPTWQEMTHGAPGTVSLVAQAGRRLVVLKDGKNLGSIEVPSRVSPGALSQKSVECHSRVTFAADPQLPADAPADSSPLTGYSRPVADNNRTSGSVFSRSSTVIRCEAREPP